MLLYFLLFCIQYFFFSESKKRNPIKRIILTLTLHRGTAHYNTWGRSPVCHPFLLINTYVFNFIVILYYFVVILCYSPHQKPTQNRKPKTGQNLKWSKMNQKWTEYIGNEIRSRVPLSLPTGTRAPEEKRHVDIAAHIYISKYSSPSTPNQMDRPLSREEYNTFRLIS